MLIYGVRHKGHFVEDIKFMKQRKNQSMYWGNKVLRKRGSGGRKEIHISLGFCFWMFAINNGTPGRLRTDLISLRGRLPALKIRGMRTVP